MEKLLFCLKVLYLLKGTSLSSTPTSDGQQASRKRRWGSLSSTKKKTTLSISTDSLKVNTKCCCLQSCNTMSGRGFFCFRDLTKYGFEKMLEKYFSGRKATDICVCKVRGFDG